MNQTLFVYRHNFPDYPACQSAMRQRAAELAEIQRHELWLVEHDSVFTLGQAADRKHLLDTGDIPVVQSNRGGQVSWHGPGQLIFYVLVHLPSLGINVRQLVSLLEDCVIRLLGDFAINASARADAPGVYVNERKIASVGLRISKGVSYHGLSFNHDCSLEPFSRINTCGYPQLEVTRLIDLCQSPGRNVVARMLCDYFAEGAGLNIHRVESR